MQSIHLYFDLPRVLYSNEKIILCAGYISESQNIDLIELIANDRVIGTCKAIPHFDKKLQKNGFLIKSNLKNIKAYEGIEFSLRTTSNTNVNSIPEVVLLKNEKNLGFYNNFESLLYQVGPSFKYICFCDQDDIWDQQKLEKQITLLENKKSDLIYSDLRIVDENRNVVSDTFWFKRSNHLSDFHALSLNNVATGSTILFRSNILKHVLPFPQYIPKIYHDHWACAITKKRGEVSYLDEALVDYVQHDFNVTGFSEFKRLSVFQRGLSFFALINICRKIAFNKNISDLFSFIKENQKVYFTNFQKLKLMYFHLDYITFKKINAKRTDLKILCQLLRLSIISPIKNYFFNRTEVALYTSIFVHYALKTRYLFRKK